MKKRKLILIFALTTIIFSCDQKKKAETTTPKIVAKSTHRKKTVVYQVFTRLFGNTNTTNKPWGTIEENGVGKFNDFTDKALSEIKDLGVTHIWYTGVPHHNVITDYTAYGISNDDPDIVKGRAGSPYAVKDYYNVNPDLAVNVENRLAEFETLIKRTHKAGLKVIIDIVPNHIARNYKSISKPKGVKDFGEEDYTALEYGVNNNFYYTPKQPFKVPNWKNNYLPLGGEKHELIDGKFDENPAKWTGNGSRTSQPSMTDWYETVKVNYGVRPDGKKDFEILKASFKHKDYNAHFKFWSEQSVPNSWEKFKDIALFWTKKGVDGFRYDMVEMVPVEFWSYMNSHIKMNNPDAFLLAEVYNPKLYRDYIKKGKMDYLYDKVQLYDTIKNIVQGRGKTDNIPAILESLSDIEHHMLHFMENHDEQRIASPEFAGNAEKGKPAMVVSALVTSSPTMIYFGQEVGEDGSENTGYGKPSRTTIFDYAGVPAHQRWMNDKRFDGGQLTLQEKNLREFYKRLLNFSISNKAITGNYKGLHKFNRDNSKNYGDKVFSFVRWLDKDQLIIISNFDGEKHQEFKLKIPEDVLKTWNRKDGIYKVTDQLYYQFSSKLVIKEGEGTIHVKLKPLESLALTIQ